MKRLSVFTLILFISFSIFAQEYFSKTFEPDEFINDRINLFSLNEESYILNEEFCNGFSQAGCVEIYKIDELGEFEHVKSVGNFKIYSNTTSVNNDILTFVGSGNNNSFTLFNYDASLNELKSKEIMTTSNAWIWNLVDYKDFIVIAIREFGLDDGANRILFIDKSDFEIAHIEAPVFLEGAGFTDPFVNSDDNLVHAIQNEDGLVEVEYDNNGEEVDYSIIYDSQEFIAYLNYVNLSSGRKAFGLDERKYLVITNNENEVEHKINMADHFDVDDLLCIDMMEASNGDILLCGVLTEGFTKGCIARINQDGDVLWTGKYRPFGSVRSKLSEIVELPDNSIIFYGSARLSPIFNNTFPDGYWVLKTDANGCIDDDCEGITSSTHQLSNLEVSIFPNPAANYINIEHSRSLTYMASLFDISGKRLIAEKNIKKMDLTTISAGTYILEILDLNSNQKIVEKIVVNK